MLLAPSWVPSGLLRQLCVHPQLQCSLPKALVNYCLQRMKHELLHPKAPRPARAFKFTCPGQTGRRCWCKIRKNSPFAPSWDKLCSSFYSGAPHRIRLRRGLHLESNPGFFPRLLSPSPYWSGTISLGNHLHVKLCPI